MFDYRNRKSWIKALKFSLRKLEEDQREEKLKYKIANGYLIKNRKNWEGEPKVREFELFLGNPNNSKIRPGRLRKEVERLFSTKDGYVNQTYNKTLFLNRLRILYTTTVIGWLSGKKASTMFRKPGLIATPSIFVIIDALKTNMMYNGDPDNTTVIFHKKVQSYLRGDDSEPLQSRVNILAEVYEKVFVPEYSETFKKFGEFVAKEVNKS